MILQLKPHDLKKWQNHYYFFLTSPNHVQRAITFTDWIQNNLRTSFRFSRRIQFFHKAFLGFEQDNIQRHNFQSVSSSTDCAQWLFSVIFFIKESFPEGEMAYWCVCRQYSVPWVQFKLESQNSYLHLFLLKSAHMDRYRILEINLTAT